MERTLLSYHKHNNTTFHLDAHSGLGNYAGLACQCLLPPGASTGVSLQEHDAAATAAAAHDWLPGGGPLDDADSHSGRGGGERMPIPLSPLFLVSASPPPLSGWVHSHHHHHHHGEGDDCGEH